MHLHFLNWVCGLGSDDMNFAMFSPSSTDWAFELVSLYKWPLIWRPVVLHLFGAANTQGVTTRKQTPLHGLNRTRQRI